MQLTIGLDQEVDTALHREHQHRRHPDEQRERRQQSDQTCRDVPVGVDRQAGHDVPEGDAEQQREPRRSCREDGVPGRPPATAGLLGAELEGHRPQDHDQQDQHEREIQPREQRRVGQREDGEQDAATEHQPDLVAIPDRADAVEERAPLHVGARQRQQQDPDAHVEAVEDQVAGDDHDEQEEPDVVEGHGSSPRSAARRLRLKTSRNVSGRLDTATVSTSSSSSGPSWILRFSRYRNRTSSSAVQHDEHPEREDDVGRAQGRGHAVGGLEDVVDDPRLAPDLGGPPARGDRRLTDEHGEDQQRQDEAGLEEPPLPQEHQPGQHARSRPGRVPS